MWRDFFFYMKAGKPDMISAGGEPELFAVLEKAYNSFTAPSDFQENGFPKFIWPSTYEPKFVTQLFGVNEDYYQKFGLPGHEGIDMRAPLDQPIIAVWDGEVSRVGFHEYAYGNHIRLHHHIKFPTGETVHYESVYAHFSVPSEWKVGDKVKQGEIIGYADSTGNSTGHHLHFNMKQFNHPELRPKTEMQMKAEWPFNIIDATPFFKWLDV